MPDKIDFISISEARDILQVDGNVALVSEEYYYYKIFLRNFIDNTRVARIMESHEFLLRISLRDLTV